MGVNTMCYRIANPLELGTLVETIPHSSNTTLHSLQSFSKVQEALEPLVSCKRNTLMDCPN